MPRHRAHSVLRVRFGARRRIFFPLLPTFYLCFRPSPTPRSPSTTQWCLPFLSLLSPMSHHLQRGFLFSILFLYPVPICSLSSIIWCFSTGLISPPFFGPVVASLDHCRPPVLFDQISSLFCLPFHPFFLEPFQSPPLPGCRAIVPVGGADEHTTGTCG